MSWKLAADYVLFRTWWDYRSAQTPWIEVPYHFFNLFEGVAWVILSGMVVRRWSGLRRSRVELAYALAFFTFGLTDFREAYVLQSWLIWVKLINLLVLLRLRSFVIRRYYPESKLY